MTDTHKTTIVHAEPRAVEHAGAQQMHPLVSAAMSAGGELDPSTLRELLAVQREWEAGEARKAYTRAMANLKRDLPRVIERDQVVDFKPRSGPPVHYTHSSLAKVVEEVVDVLTSHGFSHSWHPRTHGAKVEVSCRLTHTEGHSEECTLEAGPDNSGMKSGPQAIASTITLLQRYSLLSLLGIATADMKEPTGEPAPPPADHVNADKNLRAVAALAKVGVDKAEAEKRVGRKVERWTAADLDKLRALLNERKAAEAQAPDPAPEPPASDPLEDVLAAKTGTAMIDAAKQHAAALDALPDGEWALVEEHAKAIGVAPLTIESAVREVLDG